MTNQFSLISECPTWLLGTGAHSDIVFATRVRLARNLAGHRFVRRASLLERASIFETVSNSAAALKPLGEFKVVNFKGLQPHQQQLYVEQRLASAELVALDGDRGLLFEQSGRSAVMINEEDHLRLQRIDSGYCPKACWESIDGVDTIIGKELDFAFDARRGFLTSCPSNAGTGLRMSVLMHLPGLALTKNIDQILQAASQMGIATRGFGGEHSTVVGNLFQLSNQATMGGREIDFIENTDRVIARIMDAEYKARETVLAQAKAELTDKVQRAYGILMHAHLLEYHEFLNVSSAIRLGIECGIFSALSITDLNRLTLALQPAHVQLVCGKTMKAEALRSARARMCQEYCTSQTGSVAAAAPKKRTIRKKRTNG